MYIKVVTVKVKPKHRRAKKSYKYVRVISRRYNMEKGLYTEYIIATLGKIEEVQPSVETLCTGLQHLEL